VRSLRQTAGSNGHKLRSVAGAKNCAASQEAVMTEANQFRQYAEEAMRGSSKATSENEKLILADLAYTWAQTALASERVFGSSFSASPRDVGDATSPTRS
jgi:hypothetical protein